MVNRTRFTFLLILAGVIAAPVAMPVAVQAQKLVVTRGPYELRFEGTASDEKARAVAAAVESAAASREGLTVVPVEDRCETVLCLTEAAKAKGTDQALFASVVENVGHYDFSLVFIDRVLSGEWTGSFAEVVEKIKEMTLLSLDEQASEPEAAPASESAEVAKPAPQKPAPDAKESKPTEPKERPIKKKWPFIASVGLTVATGVALAVTETLAYRSWNKLESDDWESLGQWEEERDRHHHLQLSSRVLVCGTTLFAASSIMLFIFTDFNPKRSVAFAATPNSGFISVSGRF